MQHKSTDLHVSISTILPSVSPSTPTFTLQTRKFINLLSTIMYKIFETNFSFHEGTTEKV